MRAKLLIVLLALTGCDSSSGLTGDVGLDHVADGSPDSFVELPWDGPAPTDTTGWECLEDADCDDGDPCSIESCDLELHVCRSETRHGVAMMGPDVRITDAPATSFWPSVVWTGSRYGIFWSDGRAAGCHDRYGPLFCPKQIWFAQVDRTGTPIGSQSMIGGTDDSVSHVMDAMWTGSMFAVGWDAYDRDNERHPFMTVVDPDGLVAVDGVMPTAAEVDGGLLPDLELAGTNLFMLWATGNGYTAPPPDRQLHLTVFDLDGFETMDRALTASDRLYVSWVRMAWTGSHLAIPFEDDDPKLLLVDETGAVFDEIVYTGLEEARWQSPDILWTGSDLTLFWSGIDFSDDDPCLGLGCSNIYMRRLSADGVLLDDGLMLTDTPTESTLSQVSWTGSEFLLTWYEETGWGEEPWLSRISPAGERVAPDLAIEGRARHAWSGSEIGLVWADDGTGDWEIWFNRIGWCE